MTFMLKNFIKNNFILKIDLILNHYNTKEPNKLEKIKNLLDSEIIQLFLKSGLALKFKNIKHIFE